MREEHPVAGLDRLEAQADGQVRLADAGRAEHDDVVAVLDEVAARECLHLLPVDRGLVAEVEGLQRLDEREARHGGAHGDVLARLGRHLLAEHLLEEVGVGELLRGGVLQQRFEPLATLEQPQLQQHARSSRSSCAGVHATSSSCSYTSRSRDLDRLRRRWARRPSAGALGVARARVAGHRARAVLGIDAELDGGR